VVWSVVRAACRSIERPVKGSEGSLRLNEVGKAVVLNTFVDKEYNRKEPIIVTFDISDGEITGAW